MAQLPNPFLNSGAHVPVASGSAAVNASPPSTAAAVAISPDVQATRRLDDLGSVQDGRKMSTDGQPEAAAVVGLGAASDISHIHEIFHWVRKLMRGHQGFVLDQAAFMAEVEEVPLFVRDGDHLRRWEA